MDQYIATFHTHVSALMTARAMKAAGISARMAPVPRALSSSCGTCVFYSAKGPHLELFDQDVECVYSIQDNKEYTVLYHNE